jgi:hypothetical protein
MNSCVCVRSWSPQLNLQSSDAHRGAPSIFTGDVVTFGRKKGCAIVFDEGVLSGEHFRLEFREEHGIRTVFIMDCSTNGTWIVEPSVGKKKSVPVRLVKGQRQLIKSGTEVIVIPAATKPPREKVSMVVYIHDPAVGQDEGGPHTKYDVRELLGSGAFAQVRLCIHKFTGEKFACKIVDKAKFYTQMAASSRPNALLDEVKILQSLNHDHIVKIYECYETDRAVFMILELIRSAYDFVLVHACICPCVCDSTVG